MALPLKVFLIITTGLFFGATVWLWLSAGPQIFVTYAETFALWCF